MRLPWATDFDDNIYVYLTVVTSMSEFQESNHLFIIITFYCSPAANIIDFISGNAARMYFTCRFSWNRNTITLLSLWIKRSTIECAKIKCWGGVHTGVLSAEPPQLVLCMCGDNDTCLLEE